VSRDDDHDWRTITGAHDELRCLRHADNSDADQADVDRLSDRIADQIGSSAPEFLAQIDLVRWETRAEGYGPEHRLCRALRSLERGIQRRLQDWGILPDLAWVLSVCALFRAVRACAGGLPFV
jgi:hypothetical protein